MEAVRAGLTSRCCANAHLPHPDPHPSDLLLKNALTEIYACLARYTKHMPTIIKAIICCVIIFSETYVPNRIAVPTLYTINVTIHASALM